MAHHDIRKDKTCQNCFHVVENRFCPNCGQENSETRKSFGHLITHFVEDFTHYDNAFWTTIKYLLFRPALLTKEYLSGKRQRFVPPVKLYIFISFITFFLLSVLPRKLDSNPKNATEAQQQRKAETEAEQKAKAAAIKKARVFAVDENSKKMLDSILEEKDSGTEVDLSREFDFDDYKSVAAYDSVQKRRPPEKRNGTIVSWIKKSMIEVRLKAKEDNFKDKFMESLVHNIPKALFLYMPFFALGLWIFHGKKRWFYFDHGIFTLHYFSFLLFTFSVFTLIGSITKQFDNEAVDFLDGFLNFALLSWWFFYFFRSHRRFYMESRLISRLKSLALFFINMFFITIFLLALMTISALNVH